MGFVSFPRVLIHCWGGFGSQLYAWSLLLQLQEKNPKRKFILVLHNSGVTRRDSEIFNLVDKSEIIEVNDFDKNFESNREISKKINARFYVSTFFRLAANFLGITLAPDRKSKIPRILPWTKSIRGHYSHMEVPSKVINVFHANINFSKGELEPSTPVIGLHYRLGDLMTLSNKSPLPESRLVKSVLQISNLTHMEEIDLYSDSPFQARRLLQPLEAKLNLKVRDIPIWDTVKFLSRARVFIGTHSKISLWVCLIRSECNLSGSIFVPEEMKRDIFRNLIDPEKRANIDFY